MDYELNFEAESFQGYQGERRGYVGEYEFEDSNQDAFDTSNPNLARAVQSALSLTTGVRLPKLDRLGPQAASLLRALQKQHRIKPNGVVGPNTLSVLKRHLAGHTQGEGGFEMETWEEICAKECREVFDRCLKSPSISQMHGINCMLAQQNCSENCERRLKPKPPPPPRPVPPPPPPAPLTPPTLRPGSTHPAVKDLQNKLNVWLSKNKVAHVPRIPVTGKFGTLTELAVRGVQKANRLRVDGVVGKDTWGVLQGLK